MNKRLLEKIALILEIIEAEVKSNPKKESFDLNPDIFTKQPLLRDPVGLNRAFETITKETDKSIIASFYTIEHHDDALRVKTRPFPRISIYIENPDKLNGYYKKVKQQLNKKKSPLLILDSEGKLYRIDDKDRKLVYPMYPEGIRYKIICYLAKEKTYISAAELSLEFSKDPQAIRKSIGEIKKLIRTRLNILPYEIIESDPRNGYRVKNIKLKEN